MILNSYSASYVWFHFVYNLVQFNKKIKVQTKSIYSFSFPNIFVYIKLNILMEIKNHDDMFSEYE